MNHYRQATQKRKEEFNNYFLGGIRKGDHLSVESFLDSYAQDIRLAVIEDVRDKIEGIQTNDGKIRAIVEHTKLLILSTLKENPK